jgi:hypothetical protein
LNSIVRRPAVLKYLVIPGLIGSIIAVSLALLMAWKAAH